MQRSIPRKQSCFLYSSTMCKPRNVRTNLSFSFRDCHYLLPYMVHKIFAFNYSTQDIKSCIIFLPLILRHVTQEKPLANKRTLLVKYLRFFKVIIRHYPNYSAILPIFYQYSPFVSCVKPSHFHIAL